MHKILKITIPKFTLALLAFLCVVLAPPAGAEPTEKRMALVIGNGAYPTGALATPANDAGLIAQTLQAAGFDVVGVDRNAEGLGTLPSPIKAVAASVGPAGLPTALGLQPEPP